MIIKTIIYLTLLFFTKIALSDNSLYNGTMVDAHSQKGLDISSEKVSELINKSDVDFTLLSFRGGHRQLNKTFLTINKLTENKVRYLLPTKLSARVRGAPLPKVMRLLNRFKKGALKNSINYVGFGEILLQHSPHDNKYLKWNGVNYDLNDEGVSKVINFIINDSKPVILHVELNDYEEDSKKILRQLMELSNKYPKNNFLLIHMGQVEFSEAELIISKTNNINFITSLSDNETQNRIEKQKKGHSQTGFINLFEKDDSIQKKWIDLMNAHPKRFVLGLDRVFAGSWFTYKQKISLWRKALADLDKTTAKFIACENAKSYFKLQIACLDNRTN